ncbi:hypothetical protein NADFUDRAFT_51679 [Nadsonia fulvescens var. elongata DSM 6958]|uniref:26S proteasome complex subunit SEM1 n=1 Tax=Nadsonia fulvescens var. elongata DSM 6958 TaxID=857566 RepID=A0A1E3PIF9_9ASCO|nr:hypothetical protein NADFUDRAFT_51679 [Nadsonia fulvescens var. elongata DSM 6958]
MSTQQTQPQSIKQDSKPEVKEETQPFVTLEEDDEFEDFPAEDWTEADSDVAINGGKNHLWEENWDDDNVDDDFAVQLREELSKNSN